MSNYNYTWIDHFEDKGWDKSQIVDVTIVQRTMGTISFIGSSYVIQDVLRNEQKRNHTFHRLMVGLSISDILSSFFVHILSTAPIPKGYQLLAVGNVATCDVQGFINIMCCFVTILYNCSLATYYLVQLKYNWADRRIKALERWMQIIPWSVGLLFAITGLVFKVYGPLGFSCIVTAGYPFECTGPNSSIECIRGNPIIALFLGVSLTGFLFLAICYISVTMYRVYRSVSNIEKQAHKYSFASYRSPTKCSKRSRRVMLQGVLYSLALFFSWIFVILEICSNGAYVLNILSYTFMPLQGFFNAMIYSIPVFQRMCKSQETEDKKDKRSKSFNILSNISPKNEKNQGPVSPNFGTSNRMLSFLLGSNNNSNNKNDSIEDKNDSNEIHNNHYNQSVLNVTDNIIQGKEGNIDFDGEEEKEEIQKSSETSIIHSGLLIGDNQLKRNLESEIMNIIECTSDNQHSSDVCDREEMEGESQGQSECIFANHSSLDLRHQSEENVELGVENDVDESDYDDIDDINDDLVLSSRR